MRDDDFPDFLVVVVLFANTEALTSVLSIFLKSG